MLEDKSKLKKVILKDSIKMLSGKNYFENELRVALTKKFPLSVDEIEEVIYDLKNEKYLDDQNFLRDFIRWKVECGYGPYYIRNKLKQKQKNTDIYEIQEIINELDYNLKEVIEKAIEKYTRVKRNKKINFKTNCLNWLINRGFSFDDCIDLLK